MRTVTQNGRPLKKPGKSGTRDERVRVVSAEKQAEQLRWRKESLDCRADDLNTNFTYKNAQEMIDVNRAFARHS